MWDSSPLTSSVQLEALRMVSEWWESSRVRRPLGRLRRTARAPGGTAARGPVRSPGSRPAQLDERLARATSAAP